MLNFPFLKSQINKMVRERKEKEERFIERISVAVSELKLRSKDWQRLSQKVRESRTSWLLSGISSRLDLVFNLPPLPSAYTVLASDGSQIFPDRHEALPCYLINIGSVLIHYGSGGKAYLNSNPHLFYGDEDILTVWKGRRIPADAVIISERRNIMEFQEILGLVERCENKENVLALLDGTLILWRLEGMPEDFKGEILQSYIGVLDKMKSLRIPIAGYISFPGSTDVINALRVGLCPEEISYCDRCPYTHLPALPCSSIEGVTDRVLFSRVLKSGQRSSVFESSSSILELYGEHHILFFYLNVGEEIARVEIPKWVAEDEGLLNLTHALIFNQAKKGDGYPIALVEAHEQAVVRGKERDFFFDLVREALVKSDFKITVSRKGLSKRSPVI